MRGAGPHFDAFADDPVRGGVEYVMTVTPKVRRCYIVSPRATSVPSLSSKGAPISRDGK
jgi:hypothetical protein